MAITVSPNGRNVYESPTATDEVLVATADGIVALRRTGDGWQEARRMLAGKHVGSMVVEPSRGVIFAGTHGSGLWASEDGGQTWERRDDGITSDNFYALNYVEANGEVRIFAGTEPAQLYYSTNFGASWTELPSLRDVPSVNDWTFPGPPHIGHVKTIAFDPRDANTIYVGVEVGGAFKSTDGGQTWQELNDAGFYVDVHRLMVAPSRPDQIFMATGRGLYQSADAGTSWDSMSLPGVSGDPHGYSAGISYPDALLIHPQTPDTMFTAGANASPGAWRKNEGAYARVARSRDAGQSWEYLSGGLPTEEPANVEAMTMVTYPGGFDLFAGTTDGDVFFSRDEGEHWDTIAKALPPVSKSGHYRGLRPDWTPAAAH